MTSISDIATQITQNTKGSPLSALVEAGGRELGLEVNRLRSNLLAIPQDDQHLIFSGLCGPSTSRVATTLCKDPAWLRRTLALKDVPVPKTLKLPIGATDTARHFVADLDQPAFAAWQDHPESGVTMTADDFAAQWEKLRSLQPEEDTKVILQPVDHGTSSHVTVVFGRVVRAEVGAAEEAKRLALQAVSVLPGAHIADVTLKHQSDGSIVVDQVDVMLEKWGVTPFPEGVDEVVLAIMRGELACAKDPIPVATESTP